MIAEAKNKSYYEGIDYYIVAGKKLIPIGFMKESELNDNFWIIGKICLTYRDKILTPKYIEYAYPFRFIKSYRGVQIIQLSKENDKPYTILENKNCENKSILFESSKQVITYIENKRR